MTEPGAWPPGSSEMAIRVRALDWGATSLGPIEAWPPELRTSAAFVLENRFPAALIWGADLVTIHNDAFRPILGEKPEALGRSFAEIWSEVWDDIRPFTERAFAGESTFIEDFELTIHRHGQPEQAWFTFSYSPVRAADGTIVGMIDTVVETTGTVQSQASLRASQEQFEALLNQAPMGVYLVDDNFVIRQINPVALPVFGDIPGGPVGRDFDEVIHILWDKNYADELVRIFRHTLETGEPYLTPERAEYRADRNLVEYYEWRLDRIPLPGGRYGVVCYFRDISAQVWARQKIEEGAATLKENDSRLQLLFDSIDEGFMEVEVMMSDDGRALDWRYLSLNAAFTRLTGLLDITGKLVSEVMPDLEPEWAERYAHVVNTGQPKRFEMRAHALDRWFDVYHVRVGGPESRRVASVYNDITLRKRAEEASRENEARQAFLLKLSDALRAEQSAEAVADRALRMIYEQLALDRCYIGVFRLEEDRGELPHQLHDDSLPPMPAHVRLSDFPKAIEVASGQTLVINDIREKEDFSDDDRNNIEAFGTRAVVTATLRKAKNTPLWSLVAGSKQPRTWTQSEIALVEEVAERTWAAIERALSEEALHESEARFRAFLDTSPAFIWHNSPSGQNQFANRYFVEFVGGNEAAIGGSEWQMLVHPDEQDAYVAGYLDAVRNRRPWSDRARVLRHDGQWRSLDNKAEPLFDGAGEYLGHVGVSTDVTAEVMAGEALRDSANHQALLLAELQHRVRNILTMVRSVTRRTAENSNDVEDYVRHLDGRLSALARVQTILSREPSKGVDLYGLVLDELMSQATFPAQYDINGPEVALSAKAAEVLSLAVHELATNSVKYGVLGEMRGTIRIFWAIDDRAGQDWLCFTWNEPVDSQIKRPVRTGFGSELIKKRVPYELRGTGDIKISADEVEARIDFPLTDSQNKFDSVAAQGT